MAQLFLLVLLLLSGPARSRDAAASLLARGNGHYQRGELARAVAAYEACLQLEPGGLPSAAADAHFVPCVINLASVLVDLGGHEQRAEQLYRVALAAEPEHADAAYNLALLLHDRKTEEAVEEAATMYRVAAEAEPERWDAWANLAAALKELRREPLGALHAYERAILVLESAEQAGGGEGGGEGSYLSKLYYGYGTLLADLSPEACGALAAQPQNLLLGTAEGGMPPAQLCAAAAQNAMRTAAAVDPSNAQAEHMLAAMMGEGGAGGAGEGAPSKAAPGFVEALFDDFADSFDRKLTELEYTVPAMAGAAVDALARGRPGRPFASALDAGCGTGLAGPHLRRHVSGPLVGVDLSTKMLRIAAACTRSDGCGVQGSARDQRPLYDELLALDLETMPLPHLLRGGAGFDLIVAADVLVYFGELGPLLRNFARLSAAGAPLVFSCERATADEAAAGWRLLPSGRFAHTKEYVVREAAAAGYRLIAYEEMTPRVEKGVPVRGHLFTLGLVVWEAPVQGGATKEEL
mmetsp:Transcript_8097/g.24968  ORF Transcript_8097/g.24968 Transcript_8097/m.24968 type:complete len:522 (+) Transcript_8097:72-1637(+)